MRVVLDGLRHVVVYDQGHILNVDTTTSHVRRNQDVLGSRLKVGQGKLTLLLTLATVQSASVELLKLNRTSELAS